jgi:hypothetical protein
MSEQKNSTGASATAAENDIPRMEPWLAVSLLSFVPGLGLFILPKVAMIPLYIAMAALMTTGMGMYLRAEWRKSKSE